MLIVTNFDCIWITIHSAIAFCFDSDFLTASMVRRSQNVGEVLHEIEIKINFKLPYDLQSIVVISIVLNPFIFKFILERCW